MRFSVCVHRDVTCIGTQTLLRLLQIVGGRSLPSDDFLTLSLVGFDVRVIPHRRSPRGKRGTSALKRTSATIGILI